MQNFANPKFLKIARPYAIAAIEFARSKQQLPSWKTFLQTAAQIAKDASIIKILANPAISSTKAFDLFHEVLASLVTPEQKNFLSLLAQNKRLVVLPEIAELFDAYYASLEKITAVRVITAVEIEKEFQQVLTQALAKRVQRDVTIKCEIDPSLLGGAVIHIGDRVIDDSIRGKLTRLLEFSLR